MEPRVPRKIAFLGSGPLPLTSMCLLKALRETASRMQPASKSFDTTIVNIDRDAAAHTSAITLHESLGSWSQGMEFMCADASLVAGLEEYDVVFLAALVGVTQEEKESLTFSIARRMRPGALLVVRSAYGLRAVLYPVSTTRESTLPVTFVCNDFNTVTGGGSEHGESPVRVAGRDRYASFRKGCQLGHRSQDQRPCGRQGGGELVTCIDNSRRRRFIKFNHNHLFGSYLLFIAWVRRKRSAYVSDLPPASKLSHREASQ